MIGYGKHHKFGNENTRFYPSWIDDEALVIEDFSLSLIISMGWDTDKVDIDLHVFEPNGHEVAYFDKDSNIGGHLSKDFTQVTFFSFLSFCSLSIFLTFLLLFLFLLFSTNRVTVQKFML
jgi:hypothetical protein